VRLRKNFHLRPADVCSLVVGHGLCIATDTITVDGQKVGFMYREEPYRENDSGWRFSAGQESDEYMGNVDNLALYDVNIIANYDPEIIPLLGEPVGSAFERKEGTGSFIKVDGFRLTDDEDKPMLLH
jgi:hypothetical protein